MQTTIFNKIPFTGISLRYWHLRKNMRTINHAHEKYTLFLIKGDVHKDFLQGQDGVGFFWKLDWVGRRLYLRWTWFLFTSTSQNLYHPHPFFRNILGIASNSWIHLKYNWNVSELRSANKYDENRINDSTDRWFNEDGGTLVFLFIFNN